MKSPQELQDEVVRKLAKLIEVLDAALAEPPSKREKDERQRRFDAIMAPYL